MTDIRKYEIRNYMHFDTESMCYVGTGTIIFKKMYVTDEK